MTHKPTLASGDQANAAKARATAYLTDVEAVVAEMVGPGAPRQAFEATFVSQAIAVLVAITTQRFGPDRAAHMIGQGIGGQIEQMPAGMAAVFAVNLEDGVASGMISARAAMQPASQTRQ